MNDIKFDKVDFLFTIAIICFLISCKPNSDYFKERNQFERDMIKALNLKILSKDSTYGMARLSAIGDTVVGYVPPSYHGDSDQYFFVENPRKYRERKRFNNSELIYPSISEIDDFKNGKLYFGAFGGSFMQSLSTSGQLKEYFKKYDRDIFYVTKVMTLDDKAVVTSFNGVYVFNIKSQELIWAHRYFESPYEGLSGVVAGKLILTETQDDGITAIYCYDLNRNEVLWTKSIKSRPLLYNEQYRPHYYVDSYNGKIVLTMFDACYFLDSKSGYTISKVSWKNYFQIFERNPKYDFSGYNIIVSRQNDIVCKGIGNDKVLWELKGYYYNGLYNGKAIGVSKDMKMYAIINETSGKIEKLIKRPHSQTMEFQFIGKYILINHETICI